MRVNALRLTNFSSHEATAIGFAKPIVLIVGQLNAGKSSILQAIEYAFTGECGYHRKRTDSKSELVRDQGQHGTMEVVAETSAGTAQRIRNGIDNVESMAWDGRTMASAVGMAAAVTAATKVDTVVLSAILNTSGFFNLEEAQQKEIIIGMIGAEVTDAKVRSAWTGEADALKCLPAGKMDSVQALDNAYKYVFARRTVAKRELDELRPPEPPEGPKPPIDRIRGKLADLGKEMQDVIIAKAKLEGAASAVSGRQRLETEAAELKAALQRGGVAPADTFIHAMKDQDKILVEATKSAESLESDVLDLRVQLATTKSNIDLLATFDGRCVAGDHACPAPASDMKKALEAQKGKIVQLEADVADADKRHKEVCRIRDDRTEYNRLQNENNKLVLAAQDRKKRADRLAQIEIELKKDNPAVDTEKVTELQGQIDALKERIANGSKMMESAQSWIERERQVALVAESRKKLETEVRHLNELCDFLGAKGVRVGLIDEKISVFSDEIEKHLSGFGFSMSLTVDPWTIIINGQPVKRLSASERYRLSVAFQVGIARMSGLNFVICDGSEILTPPVFGEMMGMLAAAGLDQAIVIKTLMIPTEQFLSAPPKSPNVECFVVNNVDGVSTVVRVE